MKRLVKGLFILIMIFGTVLPIPYILRQPETYQHVIKGVNRQATMSATRLNEALNTENRNILKEVIDEVEQEKTGHDRIGKLQDITRVSFEVPKYADVDSVFKDIALHLFILTKDTVNVFDQLLPSVNILHNYFTLLDNLTKSPNKEIMQTLHKLFRSSLLQMAQEVYGNALYYQQHGNPERAHELMNIAQALVYRLKDTNDQAKKLYNKISTQQPVPFIKELQELGVMATGGMGR